MCVTSAHPCGHLVGPFFCWPHSTSHAFEIRSKKWEGYFTINLHAANCIYLRYMRLRVAAATCLRGDASCRGCGLPILWRTRALWVRRWQLVSSKIVWRLSFSCLCLEVVHWFVECEQTATHKLDLQPREQSVSCSLCIGHLEHFAFSRRAGPYLQGLFSGGGWLVWRSSWRDWLLSTKALSFLHWQRRPTHQLHLLQVWHHVELSARPRVWPLTSFLACSPWIPSFCSHPRCAWSIVWIFLPWTGVVDLYALCLHPLFDYHVWLCRPRWHHWQERTVPWLCETHCRPGQFCVAGRVWRSWCASSLLEYPRPSLNGSRHHWSLWHQCSKHCE